MYICHICNSQYKIKRSLDIHLNRKNKCNYVTPYQCKECKKYFKQNKSLIDHTIKQSCKTDEELIKNKNLIKEKQKLYETIEIIVRSNSSNRKKAEVLNMFIENDEDNILTILELNIPFEKQISLLSELKSISKNNISNVNNTITKNSNNNSNNNTTNNIQINNFGKEDLSFMDSSYFTNLIMNQHIEKGYMQLIKDIYLNKEHPENNTIKVENINNKFAHVYNNGKWDAILKYDLKERIHKKNYTILKMHYDKLKNTMSYPKKEETRTFLARDDTSDPHMMYVIDKIVLLFYNDAEVTV
jgi:hypothetical protein